MNARKILPNNARAAALEVLHRVFTQGAFASSALRAGLKNLTAPDRSLATEIVYGVLRRRAHLDRALSHASGRRFRDLDPKLHDVLRIGAYQIMFLDRVPVHAAVDTSVELAKSRGCGRGAGLINAVLRKLAAAPPESRMPAPPPLETAPIEHVALVGSVSRDVAELLVLALGANQAKQFVESSLEAAPLTLRVNLLRTSREALLLEVNGSPGRSATSVHLPSSLGALPADLPCVIEGRATPQDDASMAVVELLDPQPGERMLDVCAAPGGKTTHAAERMTNRGLIVATDRHPGRLDRVTEASQRLGLSIIRIAPVLPPVDGELFDRVLVDAPCSGLGTLRRHPEIRWRFKRSDLESLAVTQARVLAEGAARVRIGGVLVYSVCTITEQESSAQVTPLLESFELVESWRSGPHEEGAPDGFFAAKLVRKR